MWGDRCAKEERERPPHQPRRILHRRPDTKITLAPLYRDAFNAPGLGTVRFLLDGKEMSISESRVWDLRLQKR